MSDLNTVFVDLPERTTPIDAAYLNAVSKRLRSLAPGFDVVEDFGAKVDGVTDDTAAWQAAINAAGAAGGRIYSSKQGVSIIAGPLQDTGSGGANAQLVLPKRHYGGDENISIVIAGAIPPPNVVSVIGTTPLPDKHLVLKSTLTTGAGAMLGAKGPAGSPSGFTNVTLRAENVTFRMPANPTNTALDLRYAACVDLDNVIVDASSYSVPSIAAQTSPGSFGIRLPARDNGAHVRLGQVDVVGFYNGFEFSEHAFGEYVAAWACRVAHTFTVAHHASKFQRLSTYECQKGIRFTGAHYVDIDQFDIEHPASGTWVSIADVDDPSNFGRGSLWWSIVLGGVGQHGGFTKIGGANLNTYRVGTPMGSGGGDGATVYKGRDRLVAKAGDLTLTFGAAPVTGSPLIWVNGAIKWPVTDYTVTATAATFKTPLTAGDVVLLAYDTLTANPPPSWMGAPPAILPSDDFNRAFSNTTLGVTSIGAVPWAPLRGTWGINTNAAYLVSGPANIACMAVIETGVADCTVSMVFAKGDGNMGLTVRATDANNCYMIETAGTEPNTGGPGLSYETKIYKVVAGTTTQIAMGAKVQFAVGDTLTAVLSGNSIDVKRNGTTVVSVTDSTHPTATKHGLYVYSNKTAARFDSFTVTA